MSILAGGMASSSAVGAEACASRSAAKGPNRAWAGNSTATVREASATGASLKVAVRMTPRHPNDPVSSRARS